MVGGIIQARMGSSRLPGKIMLKLIDKTVLEHIVLRVKAAKLIDKVIVATTTNQKDNVVEKLCNELSVCCFRGSEENVLERYYGAAREFGADIIVRLTADDPLKDPEIIDQAIKILLDNNFDYVSNTMPPTYPEGIDVEVFKFEALKRAYYEAELSSEREHVTPYIWKNEFIFNAYNLENNEDLSQMRWTLDTNDDYQFMTCVYENLYQPNRIFHMADVINLLAKRPDLAAINSGHIRNEGYLKSIKLENQ
jgi:spore coat polysaccharide biosynthesis protein SpsF (cytidylyltransferase family)